MSLGTFEAAPEMSAQSVLFEVRREMALEKPATKRSRSRAANEWTGSGEDVAASEAVRRLAAEQAAQSTSRAKHIRRSVPAPASRTSLNDDRDLVVGPRRGLGVCSGLAATKIEACDGL